MSKLASGSQQQKIPKNGGDSSAASEDIAMMLPETATANAGVVGSSSVKSDDAVVLSGEQSTPEDELTASGQGDKQKSGTLSRLKMPKAPNIKAPKVAGKRVTLERNKDPDSLDVISRDPKSLNIHCKVQFDDIIAEPDPTVFSFDNVWTVSYKVFTSTKLWCYRIISLICAVPAAICWGIEFALLSFCTIWCWQPSLKAFEISLWYTRRIYEILLKAFIEPCFHAAGKCLSHVVVTVRHEA